MLSREIISLPPEVAAGVSAHTLRAKVCDLPLAVRTHTSRVETADQHSREVMGYAFLMHPRPTFHFLG